MGTAYDRVIDEPGEGRLTVRADCHGRGVGRTYADQNNRQSWTSDGVVELTLTMEERVDGELYCANIALNPEETRRLIDVLSVGLREWMDGERGEVGS